MSTTSEVIEKRAQVAPNAKIADDIKPHIEQFKNDGFYGPITLYSESEAADIIREVRIQNNDRSKAIYKDVNVNYDRHFDIPHLSNHVTHPTIMKYLVGILGPDVLLWRTEFFPKFPGTGETEWHQVRDYSYANGKPQIEPTASDWNAFIDITVWTTFTPANKVTGCMKFIRGSQKSEYFDESKSTSVGRDPSYNVKEADTGFFGYNFSDFMVDPNRNLDEEDVVELEMKAGEAVIFTASCVHGALPNISERETRFAIAARYVPTHVRVYPGQKNFSAHGDTFDLENYGPVLVSGNNQYDHNQMRTKNQHGDTFTKYMGN